MGRGNRRPKTLSRNGCVLFWNNPKATSHRSRSRAAFKASTGPFQLILVLLSKLRTMRRLFAFVGIAYKEIAISPKDHQHTYLKRLAPRPFHLQPALISSSRAF